MATPYRTTRKPEVLWALPIVVDLAREILTPEEYIEAEKTAVELVRTKKSQQNALDRLTTLVAPPPERPLSNVQKELQELPRFTRDSIRYLGEYVELMVRALSFELTGDAASQTRSLGSNIRRIKLRKFGVSPELLDQLTKFSSFIYSPGKHDFTLEKGQRHRFTTREVVLTAFIAMRLAEKLKKLSTSAKLQSLLM